MLDMADEDTLAACLGRLADEPERLERLAAEIAARSLQTWSDYAAAVAGLVLARRPEAEVDARMGCRFALPPPGRLQDAGGGRGAQQPAT